MQRRCRGGADKGCDGLGIPGTLGTRSIPDWKFKARERHASVPQWLRHGNCGASTVSVTTPHFTRRLLCTKCMQRGCDRHLCPSSRGRRAGCEAAKSEFQRYRSVKRTPCSSFRSPLLRRGFRDITARSKRFTPILALEAPTHQVEGCEVTDGARCERDQVCVHRQTHRCRCRGL